MGGFDQLAGLVSWPDWVGITIVPSEPTEPRRASTTACEPPATNPSADNDEWTIMTSPDSMPRPARSAVSEATVAGRWAAAIASISDATSTNLGEMFATRRQVQRRAEST